MATHFNQREIYSHAIDVYWTAQLSTLPSHGLNKRREFRSKTRINII